MDLELVFKFILIAEYSAFSIIRIIAQRAAVRAGRKTVITESRRYAVLLAAFICYEVFTFFAFIIQPEIFGWAQMTLPEWLRWLGVGLGLGALGLFAWVHRSLGKNLSATLRITEEHAMVTDGPYRWIRHPMYTAFFLLHLGAFFLTANWFIGATWLAGLVLVVATRVRREEAMLIASFGDDYREYMKRTGRFLPPVKVNGARE
jgi:protein-S-isoprenylcysteine O-methyltransferase Ste14